MREEVEDEKHFMLHCRAYDTLRQKMFKDIYAASQGKYSLEQANTEVQWQVLMQGTEDLYRQEVFECVKLFVRVAMERRTKS